MQLNSRGKFGYCSRIKYYYVSPHSSKINIHDKYQFITFLEEHILKLTFLSMKY